MRPDRLQWLVAGALVGAGVWRWLAAEDYGHEILAEIAIFVVLAMSLDLLVGYAGMVSLGHAAFFAVGAYATAGLSVLLGWPPSVATLAAILAAAVVAAVVGVFAVRLAGVFFIMITLAVGQIVYAYFFKARAFGGDNGMPGTPRWDLAAIGLDADDPAVFSALMIGAALLVYLLLAAVVRSPFGAMLLAIHQNESRVRALGCPVLRYKLAAFVLAGAIAGLAGSLTAQHTGFVSPDLAFWTVSGEVLIMVIAGGMGSLAGAACGAAFVIIARLSLSEGDFWEALHLPSVMAEYWQLVLGLIFIAVVLAAGDGIYGRLEWAWRRLAGER